MEQKKENFDRYCQIVGATDVGCTRSANEDFLGSGDTINGRVAVVCDGMGGHVGGATASHIAVETIMAFLSQDYYENPREAISNAIIAANQAILNHAQEHPELTGMGSTCVLLIIRHGEVYIGHVGDSRIYLVRRRTIVQLTKDHSFVQTLVDQGILTKEEAEKHPRKNEITNALGIPNMSAPTVRQDAIQPEAGDVFVLCSDGLSGMVDDAHIAKVASRVGEMHAQQRADHLIELARQAGGLDNITCELVEFSIAPKKNSLLGKNKNLLVSSIVLGILAIGGIVFGLTRCENNAEEERTPLNNQPEDSPQQQVKQYIEITDTLQFVLPKKSKDWETIAYIGHEQDSTQIISRDGNTIIKKYGGIFEWNTETFNSQLFQITRANQIQVKEAGQYNLELKTSDSCLLHLVIDASIPSKQKETSKNQSASSLDAATNLVNGAAKSLGVIQKEDISKTGDSIAKDSQKETPKDSVEKTEPGAKEDKEPEAEDNKSE